MTSRIFIRTGSVESSESAAKSAVAFDFAGIFQAECRHVQKSVYTGPRRVVVYRDVLLACGFFCRA